MASDDQDRIAWPEGTTEDFKRRYGEGDPDVIMLVGEYNRRAGREPGIRPIPLPRFAPITVYLSPWQRFLQRMERWWESVTAPHKA